MTRQWLVAGLVIAVLMGVNRLGWLAPVKVGIEIGARPVRWGVGQLSVISCQ